MSPAPVSPASLSPAPAPPSMSLPNVSMEIPAHVPPGLVRDFPLAARQTIYENPHEALMPAIHAGPPALMATNGYLGFYPCWVFRRSEDIKTLFQDTQNFVKKGNTGFAAMIGEDWDVIPTELDPPRHTAIRRLLNPLFTPASVAVMEHKVRERARSTVAAFRERGHCEFIREFAAPYPVSIFLDLLGLPVDRIWEFLEWEFALLHSSRIEERAAGVRAVKAYLLEVIEERRKRPGDDLISNALRLEVDGQKLTPIEVFGHCFNLYLGGLDTVSAAIGMQFAYLARNGEQQARLRADPSLLPKAMMELLRAYATTSHYRVCSQDVEVCGVLVKAGDKVMVSPALAGRDPEAYDNPGEIRFDRNAPLLTFGYGIHRCLGVYLAQREMLFALEEVLAALPPFRLRDGFAIPYRTGGVMQAAALEIEW